MDDELKLSGCRVLITGGAGFLGQALRDNLECRGVREITIPRSRDYDLTSRNDTERLFSFCQPEVVFHLAAVCGGIGANRSSPAWFLSANALMGLHVIECCRHSNVRKLICAGSVCAYPKHTPIPFRESDFWNGYPEETNAPYGTAKRMLLTACQAYRMQYGLNAVYIIPTNLYGPRDNFDANSSHVIPGMIKKFVAARDGRQPRVVCWGTGTPTRDFLYVDDAAEALAAAAERYDGAGPVNIGSGREIAMHELAKTISGLVGYSGPIHWDANHPDGQPRRCLDISLATRVLRWNPTIAIEDGLRTTIDWFTHAAASQYA